MTRKNLILEFIKKHEPVGVKKLILMLPQLTKKQVDSAICNLYANGEIDRISRGVYCSTQIAHVEKVREYCEFCEKPKHYPKVPSVWGIRPFDEACKVYGHGW